MKVEWKDLAINDLTKAYDDIKFYKGENSAKKILDKIVSKTELLENFPLMGAVEQNQDGKVRYLVEKDYKILYEINPMKGIIEILSVFDTRQDPSKMLSKED